MDTKQLIEFAEGQKILLRAAKYIYSVWSKTPIRSADINDKLAYDKLIWLVHNYQEPATYAFKQNGSGYAAHEVLTIL